jgi:hypothetical protein
MEMMSIDQLILVDRTTHCWYQTLLYVAKKAGFHMVLLCSVLFRQEHPGVLFYSPIAQSSRSLALFFGMCG